MNQNTKPVYSRISKVSNVLMILMILTLLSIGITVFLVFLGILTTPTSMGEHFFQHGDAIYFRLEQLRAGMFTLRDKLWVSTVMAFISLFLIPGMVFSIRMLKNFRDCMVFVPVNVRYSRYIAWLYLAIVICQFVFGLYTSWTPGGLAVIFNPLFFSSQYIVLGLLWLIVWILELGTDLQLDSDMTI